MRRALKILAWSLYIVGSCSLPLVYGADSPPAAPPRDSILPIIMIDPGHGGFDPGAESSSRILEKDLALQVAYKLKDLIERELHSEVILTREYDEFLPLDLRTRMANYNRVSVFISIHVNASANTNAHGFETYFLSSEASDKEAERVSAFENSVLRLEAGADQVHPDLEKILVDIYEAEILKESAELAELIHTEFSQTLYETRSRGVRQAPFHVLLGSTMPAVLIELGFISNVEDERILGTEEFQAKTAQSVMLALLKFRSRLFARTSSGANGAPLPVFDKIQEGIK